MADDDPDHFHIPAAPDLIQVGVEDDDFTPSPIEYQGDLHMRYVLTRPLEYDDHRVTRIREYIGEDDNGVLMRVSLR